MTLHSYSTTTSLLVTPDDERSVFRVIVFPGNKVRVWDLSGRISNSGISSILLPFLLVCFLSLFLFLLHRMSAIHVSVTSVRLTIPNTNGGGT